MTASRETRAVEEEEITEKGSRTKSKGKDEKLRADPFSQKKNVVVDGEKSQRQNLNVY